MKSLANPKKVRDKGDKRRAEKAEKLPWINTLAGRKGNLLGVSQCRSGENRGQRINVLVEY